MKLLSTFFSVLITVISYGQGVTADERAKSNAYFNNGDWMNAAKGFQSIAEREPQNAGARMRWGQALLYQDKYAEAIKVLEASNKIAPNFQTMYSLASANAGLKSADKAFEYLDQSITAGFAQRITFSKDKNFASLQNDKRFAAAMEKLDKSVNPCRYTPEARQFDFWIGDWEAKGINGQLAGQSHIEIMLGDCVIYENWTSTLPNEYSGKSFNFYNTATKKWQQTWVDDKGGILEFIDGEYKDGKMVFVTHPDQNNQITRLIFYNLEPTHIRQQFEVTTDGGKTWSTTTDLHYYKK